MSRNKYVRSVEPDSPHHPMFGRDPGPLNPDARPGFGAALSAEYSKWSDEHEGHSREEGMAAHREICLRLEQKYPTHREIFNQKLKEGGMDLARSHYPNPGLWPDA